MDRRRAPRHLTRSEREGSRQRLVSKAVAAELLSPPPVPDRRISDRLARYGLPTIERSVPKAFL